MAVREDSGVVFGLVRLTGLTRELLEHHHPWPQPGVRVVLAQLVQVVGVAGRRAVPGARLAGGGAHHARLRHDGVERVDLHVDVVTAAQLQLPRSAPHLRPRDTAVQGPAVLCRPTLTHVHRSAEFCRSSVTNVQCPAELHRSPIPVMGCQGSSAENLK